MAVDITNWSTPAISAEVPAEIPLKVIKEISVKIKCGADKTIEKLYSAGDVKIEEHMLYIPLTQEETAELKGSPLIQVNLYFQDGSRIASQQEHLRVYPNLKEEVMG